MLLAGSGIALAQNSIGLPSAEQLFGEDRGGTLTSEQEAQQNGEDATRGQSEFSGDQFDEETGRRVVAVPQGDLLKDVFPVALRLVLYLMGVLIFAAFVYAGINLVISRGDEDKLTAAKEMTIHIVIGAAIVGGAFALVAGVVRVLSNL